MAILDIYSQNECLTAELSPYQCMKQKSDEATLNDLTEKTLDLERELMILDSYYVEPGELVERVLMINSLMYDGESSEYWNETE